MISWQLHDSRMRPEPITIFDLSEKAGRVAIPETGSVTFTSPPKAGFHVLMEGTSFDEPTDYSGWTVSGTGYSPRFMVDGGRFKLLLNGGVTIIIR